MLAGLAGMIDLLIDSYRPITAVSRRASLYQNRWAVAMFQIHTAVMSHEFGAFQTSRASLRGPA
jgi:hypothetical protein